MTRSYSAIGEALGSRPASWIMGMVGDFENGGPVAFGYKQGASEAEPYIGRVPMPPEPPMGQPVRKLGGGSYLRLRQIIGDPGATPPIQPIVPICKSTLWAWVKKGLFPSPLKLGPRTTAWRTEEVLGYADAYNKRSSRVR